MRTAAAFLMAVIVAALVWGAAVEPHVIDEERLTVDLAGLPPSWHGQRVAVIADMQVGMWLDNTGTAGRIVERLVEQEPALVLIAGDFVYHPIGEAGGSTTKEAPGAEARAAASTVIDEAVDLVRPLTEAGIPTLAVLGNHDYGMQNRQAARQDWIARDLQQSLERTGIRVLRNEAVTVPAPAGRQPPGADSLLYVVGIGSHYAGYDSPGQALDQVPAGAPRLVMMHHPASFPAVPAEAAPLAFAGHTHGGQIAVPGAPQWSWMALLSQDDVHADGWIDGYGAAGNTLYVNRGIGFSMAPLRIGAAPEITWVELRREPETQVDGTAREN